MLLQHSPTVVVLVALPLLSRRFPLSDGAVACLVGFLLLHVLGARYVYSNVPYDRWAEALFGRSVSAVFGWERNHYDRLVHLAFGALWIRPVSEVLRRYCGVPRRLGPWLALQFVLAGSLLYEVFEWGLTFALAPEDANEYNGQQGDLWDAQKDMALALLGGLVALVAGGRSK